MTQLYKYPRTYHLPWSPGTTSDDRILSDLSSFEAMGDVVVTEKLDGENTSLYPATLHARSVDSRHHPSRDWVKRLWGQICHEIPQGMRVCGENVFARHSIKYEELPCYFLVFGIYEGERCLSWDETVEWCSLLNLEVVPTLYRGKWDEDVIKSCYTGISKYGGTQEGYVVRNAKSFSIKDFSLNVAKYVRKNHVQTSDFWMNQPIVPNKLRKAQ